MSILTSLKAPLTILFWCWCASDWGVAGDADFIQDAGAGAFSFQGDLEYFGSAFRCLLKLGSTTVYADQKLCPGLELMVFKDPFFSREKDPLAELRR